MRAAGLNRGKDKKKEVPSMASLLDARDYTGAITVIEFESKLPPSKGPCQHSLHAP